MSSKLCLMVILCPRLRAGGVRPSLSTQGFGQNKFSLAEINFLAEKRGNIKIKVLAEKRGNIILPLF